MTAGSAPVSPASHEAPPEEASTEAPKETAKDQPAPVSPWARWGTAAELAVVALALLYALVFWVRLPGQLPGEADYLALQAVLQREARPGDGLAVLPFWADRAKIYAHGIPVVALPDLAHEPDAERYPRLWVVAQPSLPRSDASASLDTLGERLTADGPHRDFGPLQLWRFTPKAGRAATYDFTAHAPGAQLVVGSPPRAEWHEFDFLPRRCLVGHGQTQLHFEGATLEHGVRIGLGSLGPFPAGVQVTVDGRALPPKEVAAGGHFETAELPAGLAPGPHAVDLAIVGRAACADVVGF